MKKILPYTILFILWTLTISSCSLRPNESTSGYQLKETRSPGANAFLTNTSEEMAAVVGISTPTQNPTEIPPQPTETSTRTEGDTASPTVEPTQQDPPTATLKPTRNSSPTPTAKPTQAASLTLTRKPIIPSSPTATPITTRVSEIDKMEQVLIPAGEFIMGSEDSEAIYTTENGRAYPENPLHKVYLDDYWIDKYEVTNGQYALCVAAGTCEPPYMVKSFTRDEYYGNPEFDNYPVIWVKWYMARAYCEWAGRRLPTEAEWEKAARGTDGRKYTWGNDPVGEDRANLCDSNCPKDWANGLYDDGYPDTAPVGSFPAGASPYGVMDMAGNVWEWMGTLIQPYPYDPLDGREDLDADGERAWRSGAWNDGYWWMRVSVRYRSVANYWYYNLGIRCASSN